METQLIHHRILTMFTSRHKMDKSSGCDWPLRASFIDWLLFNFAVNPHAATYKLHPGSLLNEVKVMTSTSPLSCVLIEGC